MIIGKICDEPSVWDEIIHDLGGHPLQLWGWGELKSAHNWSAHRVICVDDADNTVVGGAQILVRPLPGAFKRICYIPRGPVWRAGEEQGVLSAITCYVKQYLPGVALTIEPDTDSLVLPEGWRASKNTILIPRTLILDLDNDESALLGAMTKKTRQYIRKSEREGLVVRQVKRHDDIRACLDIYHQTAERAKFPLHDDQYYYDVHEKLGESSVIFAAYEGDKPIAFVWLAVSATTSFELYGGMNERGQQLRANYMLKWHSIRTCKEWGISRYDMNGLLNDGVSTFKQGFASHEDMLVGTYDYPLSSLYTLWARGLPLAKKIIRRAKRLVRG
ncbi:peptidoglycan bridge formation glycyltransferase FemA/FemB family protein [Candidatus Saccharibacteria bacterium oral taxon 955]